MSDDDGNVIHLEPRPAKPAAEKSRVANPLNLRHELRDNALTKGLVGYNEFSHKIVLQRPIPRPKIKAPNTFEPRAWTDSDDTALAEHFNSRGFKRVGRNLVRDVIELEAKSHPFHPPRQYLESVTWDGTPRLSRFLLSYCGAEAAGEDRKERKEATIYVRAVTRAFFISAVARIFEPGCKADCMAILEGPQGALKSQLLRMLAVRSEWFSDSLPHDLTSKDARAHLAGKWIVEMAEVAQFRGAQAETLKSFLSCQEDKFRPPYGRSDGSFPRQTIFVGSTNATTYLHDVTGNRRFWPVRVRSIKLGKIEPIVGQLWAEAVASYRSGEKWWLSAKHERLAAREQQSRLEFDPWHDLIADFVAAHVPGAEFTTAQVLAALSVEPDRRTRDHEMRVGKVLRQIGCERTRARRGPNRQYVYVRPEDEGGDKAQGGDKVGTPE